MRALGSDEWVTDLDAAVADVHVDEPLVVQYELGDTGEAWFVELGPTSRAGAGRHPAPDVVLRADHDVVAAIATGERSALAAFYDGALRFRGDLRRLGPAAAALVGAG